MAEQNKIVRFDSDEAAHFQTGISGWVSRHGNFWGNDERAARYEGCTHTLCEDCGEPVDRGRLVCPKCHDIRQIKRYEDLPKEEWDGKGPLYSDAINRYFWDWDEIEEYCEEEDVKKSDLRLVICEPQFLPLLSDDYGCDELAEDDELPDSVIKAIDDFNKIVREVGVVSWWPGKKAAIL